MARLLRGGNGFLSLIYLFLERLLSSVLLLRKKRRKMTDSLAWIFRIAELFSWELTKASF